MFILENVPLSGYSTMRLGGPARFLADITDKFDIPKALNWANAHKVPVVMIGGGSNVIWLDEGFSGLVLVNKIMGYQSSSYDENNEYITVGAGENWDSVVERSVAAGWSGLELLSLIPGTAGATPIQNVGAYGAEIAKSLITLEAYDLTEKKFVTLRASECDFSYRKSRFNTTDRGRFFITSVTLRLTKDIPQPPFYASLQAYFDQNNIHTYTAEAIRKGVIAVRQSKLPDPAVIANNGSFFANPTVTTAQFEAISKNHPKLADWPTKWFWQTSDDTYKLAVGALLEYLGLKGIEDATTGMATWPAQAMVLINQHATTTKQLLSFRDAIQGKVHDAFSITLQQEPELMPTQ
jgi:UDP-N-acetylmuramate dehydrogenase